MQYGSPIETLAAAIAAACYRDLPDIEYKDRDWEKWKKMTNEEQKQARSSGSVGPTIDKKRRPDYHDIEVTMFNQGWGSTALGYGGIGGQAMSSAYTVIVADLFNFCVYFGGGHLAYRVNLNEASPKGREAFRKDMAEFNMAEVSKAGKYK